MLPPSSMLHPVSFSRVAVAVTAQGSLRMSVLYVSQVLTASPYMFSVFFRVWIFCRQTTQSQVVLHVWQVLLPSGFEALLK